MLTLRLWWYRFVERLAWRLAYLLPRKVALFAFVRVFGHATSGKWGNCHPLSVTYAEAYDRWESAERAA